MPNVELKRGQEVKEDAFEIRRRVFMEEQGYTDEFDDIDELKEYVDGLYS